MTERTIQMDLSRLTSTGYGTLYGPKAQGLRAGQVIAITDLEADTIGSEVLTVDGDTAAIHAD